MSAQLGLALPTTNKSMFLWYACKQIKKYYTFDIIKIKHNTFGSKIMKFPKDKNPDVVWFLEVTMSNWKIICALQDLDTNKFYFSKSDIDVILKEIEEKLGYEKWSLSIKH